MSEETTSNQKDEETKLEQEQEITQSSTEIEGDTENESEQPAESATGEQQEQDGEVHEENVSLQQQPEQEEIKDMEEQLTVEQPSTNEEDTQLESSQQDGEANASTTTTAPVPIPIISIQADDDSEPIIVVDVDQMVTREEEKETAEELQQEKSEKLEQEGLEIIVEEEQFDREEAIEHYKKLTADIEKLQSSHNQLQHKIAEYLARKKIETKHEREIVDQEKRYQRCMDLLDQLQNDLSSMQSEFEREEQTFIARYRNRQDQVDQMRQQFSDMIRNSASFSVNSRTGKKISSQEIGHYLNILERKDAEVKVVRLENIKLQNRIQKLNQQIKDKEQLAEGLHMIDFEQLRINNADLNDKIEERNEEIHKLEKKITSTVQVLAHLKEKLQHIQTENVNKRSELAQINEQLAKKRDLLTTLKQSKDKVRSENVSLKQQGGLLGHNTLLKDFENKLDQTEIIKQQLHDVQQRHSELVLQCDTLRQKITQTRLMQTQ